MGGPALALVYTVVPHFEVYDPTQMMAFAPLQRWLQPLDWLFFAGYAFGYAAIFLAGAWLAFRRKRI